MNILISSNNKYNQSNHTYNKKSYSQINNQNNINNTQYHNKQKDQSYSSPLNSINLNIVSSRQIKNHQKNNNYSRVEFSNNLYQKCQQKYQDGNIKNKIDRHFSLIYMIDKKQVIGKGGFGKVYRVEVKGSGKSLALKQMSKSLIISKKSTPSVMNQKTLLSTLENPFLVNLHESYQDRNNLYLILDYLPGGDLRHHLSKRKFNQQEAKFIIVCILLGLRYLHSKGVIHRDIKPQNIVLDKKGYARITDLGVARPYRPNNSSDTSGTPGYMAPQVLCRQNHSYSVDYFAVGIIAHEFMLRRRPFNGRSRKQLRQQILSKQISIKKSDIPDDWSLQSGDFINKLIQRKSNQRLGNNSFDQIIKHPWLRNYPLQKIASLSVQAPWQPNLSSVIFHQDDYSSQQTQIKQLVAQNQLLLRKQEVQQLFKGYQYKRIDKID